MRTTTVLAALLSALSACATSPTRHATDEAASARRTGLELRAYPAGLIVEAQGLWPIGERDALHVEAGANITDRKDYGEHDDEQGSGGGLGVGWRRYRSADRSGRFFGARADLWSLAIDWKQDDGAKGKTDVLVLQPTAEIGQAWRVGGAWVLEASLALGLEINVDTDGEDVGEGPILLGGLSLSAGF